MKPPAINDGAGFKIQFGVYKHETSRHLVIDVAPHCGRRLHWIYKLPRLIIKANNSFRGLVQEQSVVSVVSNETPLHAQLERDIAFAAGASGPTTLWRPPLDKMKGFILLNRSSSKFVKIGRCNRQLDTPRVLSKPCRWCTPDNAFETPTAN